MIASRIPRKVLGGRGNRLVVSEAAFEHPNLVRALEPPPASQGAAQAEGVRSLRFLIDAAEARGGLPLAISIGLVAQVLLGLHALHRLRDGRAPRRFDGCYVTPDDVRVTAEGVVQLVHSNVDSVTSEASCEGETGRIAAKFSYLSPEQLARAEVDRRSDVFSAGVLLYLLSTGKHPFKHAGTPAVIHSIASDLQVPSPSSIVLGYPRELERVVVRALERKPARRFASAAAMQAAIRRAVPGYAEVGSPPEIAKFMAGLIDAAKQHRSDVAPGLQPSTPVPDEGADVESAPCASEPVETRLSLEAVTIPASSDGAGAAAAPRLTSVARTVAVACLAVLTGVLAGYGWKARGSGGLPLAHQAAAQLVSESPRAATLVTAALAPRQEIIGVDDLPVEAEEPQAPDAVAPPRKAHAKPATTQRSPRRRPVTWSAAKAFVRGTSQPKPDFGI